MGGQACVLYGAAEFSRDTDLVVPADAENMKRLSEALAELQAECIAVPPFDPVYLEMGLAVHFRCQHPDALNMRVDVMSTLRGVESFSMLWDRRTSVAIDEETIETLSLPDLVQAKKTQRDKDWPMIARLLEANYFANRDNPTEEQVTFWLQELRTALLLIEVAARFPDEFRRETSNRELLLLTVAANETALEQALKEEEEKAILRKIRTFPEILLACGEELSPHPIPYYLVDLSTLFHHFYQKHRVVTEEISLTRARLRLVEGVRTVIRNGLSLIGVSAPEEM